MSMRINLDCTVSVSFRGSGKDVAALRRFVELAENYDEESGLSKKDEEFVAEYGADIEMASAALEHLGIGAGDIPQKPDKAGVYTLEFEITQNADGPYDADACFEYMGSILIVSPTMWPVDGNLSCDITCLFPKGLEYFIDITGDYDCGNGNYFNVQTASQSKSGECFYNSYPCSLSTYLFTTYRNDVFDDLTRAENKRWLLEPAGTDAEKAAAEREIEAAKAAIRATDKSFKILTVVFDECREGAPDFSDCDFWEDSVEGRGYEDYKVDDESLTSALAFLKKLTDAGPGYGPTGEAVSCLNLTDCGLLTALPEVIAEFDFIKEINLSGCTGLTALPESILRKAIAGKLILGYVPDKLQTPELCLAMVQQDKDNFSKMPAEICTLALLTKAKAGIIEKNEAAKAVKQNGKALARVALELRTPELCLAAVQQNGYALEYVPKKLKTPEICRVSVQQNANALRYVPEDIKTVEFLRSAGIDEGSIFNNLPDKYKTAEICLAAVKQNSVYRDYTKYVPYAVWQDKKFCLAFLQLDRSSISSIPEELRTKEICLAAVQQNDMALDYVPEELRTKEICLAAVQQWGGALDYVPEKLRTKEICLAAVQQDGFALWNVPEELRTKEICLAAVQQSSGALEYVPFKLKAQVAKECGINNDVDSDDDESPIEEVVLTSVAAKKKTPPKKAAAKKPAAKKTAAKKPAAKKPATKKAPAKKPRKGKSK